MSNRCVLRQCPYFKYQRNQENSGFRCHKFPNDPDIHKIWEKWVKMNHVVGGLSIHKRSGLCSAHFTKDSYIPFTTRLKADAVPSIAPQLTAELALKLGMISKPEDFMELPEYVKSGSMTERDVRQLSANADCVPSPSEPQDVMREEGNCEDSMVPLVTEQLCMEESHAGHCSQNFEFHKRKKRSLAGGAHGDPLPSTAGDVLKGDADCSMSESDCSSDSQSLISDDEIPLDEADTSFGGNESILEPGVGSNQSSDSTPVIEGGNTIKRRRIAYLGDITPGKLSSPRSTAKVLKVIQQRNTKGQKDRKIMKQKLRRARQKITDLKSLLHHLTQKNNMLPAEVAKTIEDKLAGPAARVITSILSGKKPSKYDAEVREFALTLNFHSPAAYNYVKTKLLNNYLPHPRTLSKWYGAIDGKPGFTEEALAAIKCQVELLRAKGQKLCLSLVHDEMAVRRQTTYTNDGLVGGFVDDGSDDVNDDSPVVRNAWVFMVVAINGSWKICVGYFFIDSMGAAARKNLLKRCLEVLHDTGAEVESCTFDGTRTNIATVEALGAVLQPGPAWKPYFPHPVTQEPVYIILDAAHMIKLWRNVFGSKVQLQDAEGRSISFDYVRKLHDVQEKEGLRAGNKVSKRHVDFQREKMKVYLATQVLSTSVADAIDACRDDWHLPEFRGSEATVKFIRIADTVFDILNSTKPGSPSPFKRALSPSNIAEVRVKMAEARNYILGLKAKGPKDVVFTPILETKWYTGFLGFLVDMASVDALYEKLAVEKLIDGELKKHYSFCQHTS